MKSFAALPLLLPAVAAHGFITSPAARMPGPKMAAACGEQVFNNQKADNYGNVQGELQVATSQPDYKAAACDVWLCKGFKLEDAASSDVQSLTGGQKLPIEVDIRAPHTGSANVSIVDTAANAVIGEPLISWDVYASNSATIPDGQKNFEVTIPQGLGSKCASPGNCVIQWFWDAPDIDQTYESCIDFTVSGGGGGEAEEVPSAPTTTAAASVPTATTPAAVPTASSSAAPYVTLPSSMMTYAVPTALPTGAAGTVPTQEVAEGTTMGGKYLLEDAVCLLYVAGANGITNRSRRLDQLRHGQGVWRRLEREAPPSRHDGARLGKICSNALVSPDVPAS